jgi:deazaflavin-dependent oxidoreductase (nitroreductase family)
VNVDPFFTRLNPVVAWLLRSPLHGLASRGLALLTITGRRSGRRYSIPVGYQREDSHLIVMVSHADTKQWWRNFREPGPVDVRLRGRDVEGRARLVDPTSSEFASRVEETFRRVPMMGAQFGIRFDRKAGLSEEQLAQLRQTCAVVEIDLASR